MSITVNVRSIPGLKETITLSIYSRFPTLENHFAQIVGDPAGGRGVAIIFFFGGYKFSKLIVELFGDV